MRRGEEGGVPARAQARREGDAEGQRQAKASLPQVPPQARPHLVIKVKLGLPAYGGGVGARGV